MLNKGASLIDDFVLIMEAIMEWATEVSRNRASYQHVWQMAKLSLMFSGTEVYIRLSGTPHKLYCNSHTRQLRERERERLGHWDRETNSYRQNDP